MNNIFQFYIVKIHKHTFGRDDATEVSYSCKNILNEIIEQNNLSKDSIFNYSSLFKKSKLKEEDKNVFIQSVYVLAHINVKVLEQRFHYLDNTGCWEEMDLENIFQSYKENEFYNPITHEKINEKKFNDIVLPYFCPTEELISLLKGVRQ